MARPSLRMAINAQCKECIHDPLAPGTWRAQVHACTAKRCPLYRVRPLASAGERKALVRDGAVTVAK